MADEILQLGNLGPKQDDGYTRVTDTFVVVQGDRCTFPSDYDFAVQDGSLVVRDDRGDISMILAPGAWDAAVMAGTQVSTDG